MRALTHLISMVLAPVVVLASVSPAATQLSKPPRDPVMIQQKLQRSVDLQRQALQALGDRERAERLVESAWNGVKAANDDMVLNKNNTKFPDPLFPVNIRKLDQALDLLQGALDRLRAKNQWTGEAGQVQEVRAKLEQSVRLTTAVAATTF